jgi:hypothetical protein
MEVVDMKVETTSHLVAETQEEAMLLADLFNKMYGGTWRKRAVMVWRLTLPSPKEKS